MTRDRGGAVYEVRERCSHFTQVRWIECPSWKAERERRRCMALYLRKPRPGGIVPGHASAFEYRYAWVAGKGRAAAGHRPLARDAAILDAPPRPTVPEGNIFATRLLFSKKKMVLPVRIELTTSALPRMRSTTELRQHTTGIAAGRSGAKRRGRAGCQAMSVTGRRFGMTDADKKAAERAERMAAALRANLRKRKAQARGDTPDAPPAAPET